MEDAPLEHHALREPAFESAVEVQQRRVGVIVSGGNVDLARYAALIAD